MLLFILALLPISLLGSMDISPVNIMAPHTLGAIKLMHQDDVFYVESEGSQHMVPKHQMDPELRKITKKQLEKFLDNGYLSVGKNSANEYTLKAKVRGLGGGPMGASAGVVVGAAAVQLAYHGALGALYAGLSCVITPIGATAVVGTVRWATTPAALLATKTVALASGIALGVATGPF